MSILAIVALLLGTAAVVAATPACAQRMTIADDNMPAFYQAYNSQATTPSLLSPMNSRLVERPLAEIILTRLGIAEGKVVLFRYRLEDAPSQATVLNGVVDGGGFKLKLSW
jgi:hypothetical protein